jgi:ATP-independent RNA helicase DbpA
VPDPAPSLEFSSLPLAPPLLQALASLSYERMTPIQALSLPPMLAGRDVIGQARTGTGKTAAYGLALLSRLDPTLQRVQALVLCPTRELADQIAKEIRRLARCLPNIKLTVLSGGIGTRPQLASLEHDPHLVVGMAGRVQELLDMGSLNLDDLKVLVLDEADRMLGADFEQATRAIVARTPVARQTLLFSATLPDPIRALARSLQKQAVEATADPAGALPDLVQVFYAVAPERRLDALAHLLSTQRPESALVFCHTRGDVEEVEAGLRGRGFSVLALHGHVDQREREEVLVRFANGSCRVLVATDIAARGLDIKKLAAVISYELPKEPEAHLHRVGRTARAGCGGHAWHLVAPQDRERLRAIEAPAGEAGRGSPAATRGGDAVRRRRPRRQAAPRRPARRADRRGRHRQGGGRQDQHLRYADLLRDRPHAGRAGAAAPGRRQDQGAQVPRAPDRLRRPCDR